MPIFPSLPSLTRPRRRFFSPRSPNRRRALTAGHSAVSSSFSSSSSFPAPHDDSVLSPSTVARPPALATRRRPQKPTPTSIAGALAPAPTPVTLSLLSPVHPKPCLPYPLLWSFQRRRCNSQSLPSSSRGHLEHPKIEHPNTRLGP